MIDYDAPYNVRVIEDLMEVERTWPERLFSWPWRPRVKTKTIPHPLCPPDNEVIQYAGLLITNRRTYPFLMARLDHMYPASGCGDEYANH